MYIEISLLVLLLFIIILYLLFNRYTLIPIQIDSYLHTEKDNVIQIPIVNSV